MNFTRKFHNRSLVGLIRLGMVYGRLIWHHTTPTKLANYILVKIQKYLKITKVRGMPYRYRIEPTNICNLHCPLCVTGMGFLGRQNGSMHLDEYKNLVDQIAPYAYILILFHSGEPLLHPKLADMIRYAKQKKIFVIINSHLNYLSPQKAKDLVASGLDLINISIDGSTQEVYETYRIGGNLETVLNNILLLNKEKELQKRATPLINIRFLIMRQNEHQLEAVKQMAQNLNVNFSTGQIFFDFRDPEQMKKWLPSDQVRASYVNHQEYQDVKHCADLWENMVIYENGKVAPCCWFSHEEHVIGDSFTTPIRTIWNSEPYIRSRQVFTNKSYGDQLVNTCASCKGKPLQSELLLEKYHPPQNSG